MRAPMNDDRRRREDRAPIGLLVKLGFSGTEELVEKHAVNLSKGGLFLRSTEPRPVGTRVRVELRLRDGTAVLRGDGAVRWVQLAEPNAHPPKAAGMGVQFEQLDEAGRALVQQAYELLASRGLNVEAPPVITAPPEPVAAPAPAPESRPEPRRIDIGRLQAPPGVAIGIDLGTTYSAVAIVKDGRPQIVESREGHRTLPSVVSFSESGSPIIGRRAREARASRPERTIYGAKRLLGLPFDSPQVEDCIKHFPWKIVESENGAAAAIDGRIYPLEQIAAFLLKEMRTLAEDVLGAPIARAVVTVPAWYGERQRQSVRRAAQLAGLKLDRIVNEPTAAALAYAHGKTLEERLLVYDLGGGTFDASVLELSGDVYEVVATGGDTFLGGIDFDNRLADWLLAEFEKETGLAVTDVASRVRAVEAAEQAKLELSEKTESIVRIPFFAKVGGRDVDLTLRVTRAQFEHAVEELVERTFRVIDRVLSVRGLTVQDIDSVLLVGGQSRMPRVRQRLREKFGKEPSRHVHPDEAVALGAALLADSTDRIDSVVLIDLLPASIGVGLPGGAFKIVLPARAQLPVQRTYVAATTEDDQRTLEIVVFQGEGERAQENSYLGTVRVTDLTPGAAGAVKVQVTFSLGDECLLTVKAREVDSGREVQASLATLDSPEALRAKFGPRILEQVAPPTPAATQAPAASGPSAKRGLLNRLLGRK